MKRGVVLLDRDGTIIEERHYLADPARVDLIRGVASGLRRLSEMGLGLVVITNQSPIGRGLFDDKQLDLIHQRLRDLLLAEGVELEGIYYCPHRPEDGCDCRKPKAALVERAARELAFDPAVSFVVGDKSSDIELGRRVRATTFLVRTGYGEQACADPDIQADYVVDGLRDVPGIVQRLLETKEKAVSYATNRG